MAGEIPFVRTDGDCKENHARAIIRALELGSQSAQTLIRLEENSKDYQTSVRTTLGEIRGELKKITARMVEGDQKSALAQRDTQQTIKDLDGIGDKIRTHLEWHTERYGLKEERRYQLLKEIRSPALRWLVIGIMSLVGVGAVVTVWQMISKILPVIKS